MAQKQATLVVFRSDRELWNDGPLKCRVIDLFRSGGPRVLLTREIPATVELELDLSFDAGQGYGISIDAKGHRSGWHVLSRRSFIRVEDLQQREVDSVIVRPMLVANDATPSNLAAAFRTLEQQGSPFALFGSERFNGLRSAAAKLAFLNLEAKLRETRIGTRSLLSLVRDVREAAVDRVFLFMASEAKSLVAGAPDFAEAPGHEAPSDFSGLPAHPDSWKHGKYEFGNLQLSFSRAATPHRIGDSSELCFSVDCDVDLERDLGHAFEFIHNKVFQKKTDQTLVYRLLWDQGILPAYRLMPGVVPAAMARMRVAVAMPSAPAPAARGRRLARKSVGRAAKARSTARQRKSRKTRKPR
jgi:hypothetical protein